MSKFIYSGFADEISPSVSLQFAHLKKLGIEYFEVRGVEGKNIADLTTDEAKKLKEYMDKCNVKASSIGSPIGKIKITDDFEEHLKRLEHVIEIAKILDTRYIRMFSFYIPEGEDALKYEDEVIRRLKKMAEVAKEHGVILLHENEKGIFGDIPSRCKTIMEQVGSENFKAVFDPANFVQCGVNTIEAFELLAPYVEYMHIKDATLNGANVPAGMGEGHYPEIIEKLYKTGYEGFLSLEPHLGNFVGVAALETDDKMEKLEASTPEKFTLALNHIKKIVERVEKQ